jgi:hypothetical protein
MTSGVRLVELSLLVHQIANRTGDELCPLTDGRDRAESGEVEEQKLSAVARQQGCGSGGDWVIDHQWGFGTSNLTSHGRTEPKTKILQLARESIIFDGSATAFTRLPGGEVLLCKEQTNILGRT